MVNFKHTMEDEELDPTINAITWGGTQNGACTDGLEPRTIKKYSLGSPKFDVV